MRIIAFITDGPTVRDILAHCGEPTAPPRSAPARGPRPWDLPDAGPGASIPTPSRHRRSSSINASPGNLRPSTASACDAGPVRACGRRHARRTA
jgi:hypothetical protein